MRLLRRVALVSAVFSAMLTITSHGAIAALDAFARLPVQDGGRIMPMDSLARLRLLQFSGRTSLGNEPAVSWLARLLFDPDRVHTQKIFLVNHPEVLEAIGVEAGDARRFSFEQLEGGLAKLRSMAQAASQIEDKNRMPVEKEIIRLHYNLHAYIELTHSFRFALPSPDFAVNDPELRRLLQLPDDAAQMSFLDLFFKAPLMSPELQRISNKEASAWTAAEKDLFNLSASLYRWGQFYRGLPPAMIPIQGHGRRQWLSPWDVLAMGFGNDELRRELGWLQEMARAYTDGRKVEFDIAAHSFERSVRSRAGEDRGLRYTNLELLYNRLDPFYRAELLYGVGFLACLLFMMIDRRLVYWAVWLLVAVALVPHTWGLVSRMLIMGRPPVTNLFATFIFVSWMCVALGLILERFQRNALGLLLASVAGLALLMVSGRFAAQGDTLGVVVAVLDSNFWLSTHVVTITIGYAGCVAAGVAGHLYLLRAIRRPPDDPVLAATARAVYGLLAFGLIFSFLGTMLGGVWADQSWGRFWGWDPKENGALLIVLWCSLLFHARISKMIGPVGMAVGSVLGVIVVLMAWLGINLLGVGLHSYGFTSGVARGLWLSIAFELLFVSFTYPFVKKAAQIFPTSGKMG